MFRAFNNPVFNREFSDFAKSWTTYIAALALITVPGLTLSFLWPRSGVFSEINGNEIFTVFLTAELGLILLITPAFTASSITSEREKGSLDLLFTTMLRPWEILTGKLLSACFIILLILLISLPVITVCSLSGGISPALLVKTFGIIALAAFTYGLAGLMISAICRRTFTAVIVSYGTVGILAGATWIPSVLLRQIVSLQSLWQVLRSLSPFEAMLALTQPARYQTDSQSVMTASTAEIYTAGMILLSLIFAAGFCFFMRRPLRAKKSRDDEQYSDPRTAMKRRLGFPFYLIDPLRRKKPIAGWRNPVFAAELRSKLLGKPKFVIRALTVCLGLSLGILILASINYATLFGPEQVRLVAVTFQFGIIVILAPVISSGSISEERTSDTLTLLRMTPLSAWRTIVGKLKAAFLYIVIFLISSIPVLYALAYLETDSVYWRIGGWAGILLLAALVYLITGLCCSTIFKSTATATAVSYAIVFAVSMLTLTVLAFGTRISDQVKAIVLTLNPLAAALQITSDKWFSDLPYIFGNRLWVNHLWVYGVAAGILLSISIIRLHSLLKKRT